MNKNIKINSKNEIQDFKDKYYINIKFGRKRKKISNDDFIIPNNGNLIDYNIFHSINHNVKQLKMLCKCYKLKKGGNKGQLIYRLFNYLKLSGYAIKIQKIYRGKLRRKFNRLKGVACFNRICTNQTDFLSLIDLKKISYSQFFSYIDEDNFIYGFNIKSLYNLFKNQKQLKNPYNRRTFPKDVVEKLRENIRFGNLLNEPINVILEDTINKLSQKKVMELKAISLFHKIDSFGYISNANWFLLLEKPMLIRFIRELADIWNYRLSISLITKRLICPPHGNPFRGINILSLIQQNEPTLKRNILYIIENMVSKTNSSEYQHLGGMYVLGALTLVCHEAAVSLPWLYQSFRTQ